MRDSNILLDQFKRTPRFYEYHYDRTCPSLSARPDSWQVRAVHANNRIADQPQIDVLRYKRLRQIWTFTCCGGVGVKPIVNGERVYFLSGGGYAYCVNKRSGRLLWKRMIALGREAELKDFAGPGITLGDCWYVARRGLGGGGLLASLNLHTGCLHWQITLPEGVDPVGVQADGENVYLLANGLDSAQQTGIYAYTQAQGQALWSLAVAGSGNLHEATLGATAALLLKDRRLYVSVHKRRGWRRSEEVVAADLSSGSLLWKYGTRVCESEPVLTGGVPALFKISGKVMVGVPLQDGFYYCFEADTGKIRWHTRLELGPFPAGNGWQADAASIGGGKIIVTARQLSGREVLQQKMLALEIHSGRQLWRTRSPFAGYSSGVLCNDLFVWADQKGMLRGCDSQNGGALKRSFVNGGEVAADITAQGDCLYVGALDPAASGTPGLTAWQVE